MREEYVYLCTALSGWTDAELNQFHDALRRDRSLEYAELAKCMPNKNKAEIQVLTQALMSVTEEEIVGMDELNLIAPAKPEASIDILMQSTRHVSPSEFSFSSVIVEALENMANSLKSNERLTQTNETDPAMNIGLRYSELYSFLSALSSCRKLPWLTEPASGAVLDLLTRLVEIMKLVTEESDRLPPDSDEQRKEATDYRSAYRAASEKIVEYVGLYLACSAVIHLSFFRNPGPKQWDLDAIKQIPVAPFFVLNSVEQPASLKAIRALRQNLLGKFAKLWNLPTLPTGANPSNLRNDPSNPLFQQVVKRMSMFALNPFALPISVISPMKALVSRVCREQIPRNPDVRHLMCSLSQSLAHEPTGHLAIPTLSEVKRRYADSPLKPPQPKRRRVIDKDQLNAVPAVNPEQETPQQNASTTRNLTSLPTGWKPSDFSRRVTTEKDVVVTKATYRRFFRIRDSIL